MIFEITVAPTACRYFVCLLRECPACVRLGNAKASFHATLGSVVIPDLIENLHYLIRIIQKG